MQRQWFLSYHSPDYALAERLKLAIERSDKGSRVFFAPANLRAGGFWSAQLAQEIAEATAFILLVGERGVGNWQVLEYDEALDRRVKHPDFPVVLVLLEGQTAPGLPFLRRLHWITSRDPAADKEVARLIEATAGSGTRPGELWRHASPYRGLAAMEEKDSDYFFGRGRETVEVINTLAASPDKLPILLGNSGVGKSSLAQAGVLAACMRQAWPESANAGAWPQAFASSRRWCALTLKPGDEPVRALVEPFLRSWQFDAADPRRAELMSSWVDKLVAGAVGLRDLMDATELRYKDELHQPGPPAFLLYVDQGEELYTRGEEKERRRFSEILAQGLADPRLHALMSLRADFFGELQKDEPLYKAHRLINVPPLREGELGEVVARPAELLSARFETGHLAADIARRAAEESARDAGALPLLSYLLDDMWRSMVQKGDGVLRLPAQSIDLGRVLVDRADAFISSHPNSEDKLRRILTLKLATVREDGEPTRRRAWREEFSDAEWRLVSELADHPNRLLVTAAADGGVTPVDSQRSEAPAHVAPAAAETYAEVAHEAIFRRWDKLREWIAGEREFLAWRTGLEAARRAWQATADRLKNDALLMGLPLAQAQSWLAKRAEDIPQADREFIGRSRTAMQRRRLRVQALVGLLVVAMAAGLVGWLNEAYLQERMNWFMTMRPYMQAQFLPHVLTPELERALEAGKSFRECAKDCPEMVKVQAGEFTMGSPADENGRYDDEGPQHKVIFAKPFAVSKFDITFEQWDACAAVGGCGYYRPSDASWGRATRPVIYVSWDDAQNYVAWLSKMTGQAYRLLSEAEWEYAARAGTQTAYSWGDEIGRNNANCDGCGSQWAGKQTAPVGSFAANAFGLYDMHGNVWQWVQDCYQDSYDAAPTDGSAKTSGDCSRRVVRGGSWGNVPRPLRSAARFWFSPDFRNYSFGFRVGRKLTP